MGALVEVNVGEVDWLIGAGLDGRDGEVQAASRRKINA